MQSAERAPGILFAHVPTFFSDSLSREARAPHSFGKSFALRPGQSQISAIAVRSGGAARHHARLVLLPAIV